MTHYIDLIDQLATQHKVKQPELAKLLNTNPRTYRRMVERGLTFEQVTKILQHFGVSLCVTKTTKEGVLYISLGQ